MVALLLLLTIPLPESPRYLLGAAEKDRAVKVALEAQPTELREELRKAREESERLLKEARDEARAAASNPG